MSVELWQVSVVLSVASMLVSFGTAIYAHRFRKREERRREQWAERHALDDPAAR